MCACNGGASAPQNRNGANRAARSLVSSQACLKPIEYFTAIDYTHWEPGEQSLIKSLLNTYHNRCNSYAESVIAIQERYQGVLQPEAE